MASDALTAAPLSAEVGAQLARLVGVRRALRAEREQAVSPAVAHALRLADVYLFMALGYLGHLDELFPEEE